MIGKIQETLSRNRGKVAFSVYFIVTLASSYFVANMLARGWQKGHIVRVIFQHGPAELLGLSKAIVSVFLLGLYLGILILINIDPKKRWQGRLLLIGTIVGIIVMQSQGVFVVPIVSYPHYLVAGIALGFLAGGGTLLFKNRTAEALEFRRASSLLFYLMAVLTIGGFLEAHLIYPRIFEWGPFIDGIQLVWPPESTDIGLRQNGILVDIAAMGIFIGTLRQFIRYDAERSFFILGPPESGKTLFLIGAYLRALESYDGDGGMWETPMNPTRDLMQMVEALDRNQEEWIVGATEPGEVQELGFRYVHGTAFPLNITLRGLDYAGEHLEALPDAVTGVLDVQDYPNPAILQALVDNIDEADTLIFLIDVERFMNEDESLSISEYFNLLQAVEGKDVILVASKCDLLAEEFSQERGLEPVRYFDDFVEYVNDRLMESQQIRALVGETAGTEIHPVYYQTRETDSGERVPMRDDTNSVVVVGFDELLDKLAK